MVIPFCLTGEACLALWGKSSAKSSLIFLTIADHEMRRKFCRISRNVRKKKSRSLEIRHFSKNARMKTDFGGDRPIESVH
jgi:hypothetical protein